MPLYTYECPDGHKTEVNCPIKDRQDVVECKECGKEAKIVVVSAGLIAGKTPQHKTKRQQFKDRLASREERLKDWEKTSPDGKKKAEQFRRLSRSITNGKF